MKAKLHIALVAAVTSVTVLGLGSRITGSRSSATVPGSPAGSTPSARVGAPDSVAVALVCDADIAAGTIGVVTVGGLDDARDNVFHLHLSREPRPGERIWLAYELNGLADHSAVARSFNHAPVFGGVIVGRSAAWSHQREPLRREDVIMGRNTVQFATRDANRCAYRIRNVRLVVEPDGTEERDVVVTSAVGSADGTATYVGGFLTGAGSTAARLIIDGHEVPSVSGSFEWFEHDQKESRGRRAVAVQVIYPNGSEIQRTVHVERTAGTGLVLPFERVETCAATNVVPELPFSLGLRGANIAADSTTIAQALRVSITPLRAVDLAPLPADLVNVTGHGRGFRFLPDGTVFKKPVALSLAFDPALLPEGYTPADIRTYYFDEGVRSWKSVPLDTLLACDTLVRSFTTHFTDYINGIIQVPESPETMGYTPTSIKDFKAGDVSAGITPLAPPMASNTGAATTRFPIKLPPGRQGMQPELTIQYNSEGGNGWLGQGWDLQIPAITIDTRWGAPRYLDSLETETYLLEGTMLAPVAHRSSWVARTEEKHFHPRVEGSFRNIIRHGDHPWNYYWEVTDKAGTTSFYGGVSGLDTAAVLRDGTGNIARWQLAKVIDTNGNNILYSYDVVDHSGTPGSANLGQQIYPRRIWYTGSDNEEGRYSVVFTRDQGVRSDKIVTCRQGLKEVTADRLTGVTVLFDSQQIRRYGLQYTSGAFYRSLLKRITEHDAQDDQFYEHSYSYFDEVRVDGQYVPYEADAEQWNAQYDGLKGDMLIGTRPITSLGGSNSGGYGFGAAITVGPNGSTSKKEISIGGHFNHSRSTSTGILALMDVDGDNLPDKVYKKGAGLFFRSNRIRQGVFGFGDEDAVASWPSSMNFSKSISRTNAGGLEAHPSNSFFGIEGSWSKSTTREYMLDRNGDGLIDFANDGRVYFNHRNVLNQQALSLLSLDTENPVVQNGDLIVGALDANELQQLDSLNPLHDVVRVWMAPYKGTVIISGDVELLDGGEEADLYGKSDGVFASIQFGDELSVLEMDTNMVGPQPIVCPWCVNGIDVEEGEKIFFRLCSRYDGAFDRVVWSPTVEYTQVQQPDLDPQNLSVRVDANGNDLYRFNAGEAFLLSGNHQVLMTDTGHVVLDGHFEKGPTSDSVVVKILLVNAVGVVNTVWTHTFGPDAEEQEIVPSGGVDVFFDEYMLFQVTSPTNIDWTQIKWRPRLYFDSAQNYPHEQLFLQNEAGQDSLPLIPLMVHSPLPYLGMYNVLAKRCLNDQGVFQDIAIPRPYTALDPGIFTVTPAFTYAVIPGPDGFVTLSLKAPGRLLSRHTYFRTAGQFTDVGVGVSADVAQGDTVYVEYHVSDERMLTDSLCINTGFSGVTLSGGEVGVWTTVDSCSLKFGELYRNWGAFIYNFKAHSESLDSLDRMEEVVLDHPDCVNGYAVDDIDIEGIDSETSLDGSIDPTREPFVYMWPDHASGLLRGYDELTYIRGDTVSCSRMGEDDLSFDFTGDVAAYMAKAPNKITKSRSFSGSGGPTFPYGGSTASLSTGWSKTVLDVQDLNGDRYPDILGSDEIQYTLPWGDYETFTRPNAKGNYSSTNSSVGLAASGSYARTKQTRVVTFNPNASRAPASTTSGINLANATNSETVTTKTSFGFSVSGSVNVGEDEAQVIWLDVNGDGLPDKLDHDSVWLNLGHRFLPGEDWGISILQDGQSFDTGLGGGINVYNGSFQAGFSRSTSESEPQTAYFDLTGDGLPDLVNRDPLGMIRIRMNRGSQFAPWQDWLPDEAFEKSSSDGQAINAGFTFGFNLFGFRILINPSGSVSSGVSRTATQFLDINGDGGPDHLSSDAENQIAVRLSTIGKTNLLKEVRGPFNTKFTLDYEIAGNTYELPQSKWVMTSVKVFDGHMGDGADTVHTTFEYADGQYDRRERETYGFGTVRTKEWDTQSTSDEPYRTSVQTYDVSGYYTKGLPLNKAMYAGTTTKYTETVNTYELHDEDGNTLPSGFNANNDSSWAFPALVRTDDLFYEGLPDPPGMHRVVTYAYDAIGNVTLYTDSGNVDNDDVVTANIDYWSYPVPYIMGQPKEVEIKVDDNTVRHRSQLVDEATGNVTEIKQKIDGSTDAVYNLYYDEDNGNLTRVERPANHLDQRMSYDYAYDTTVATYVTQVKDVFHYRSESTYEYLFGQLIESSDINHQVTKYHVDSKGRVDNVIGPYEVAASLPYTIKIDYHPEAPTPYSRVEHYDPEHPSDGIDTYTFLDGFFRPIQVKKRAVIAANDPSTTSEGYIISGPITFDAFGRQTKELLPIANNDTAWHYSTYDSPYFSLTQFDVLDRKVTVALPHELGEPAEVTNYEYGFDNDQFLTRIIDPLGNKKESLTDIRGRQVARRDFDPTEIATRFHYNGVGDLLDVTDAGNNATTYTYDLLGRKLTYNHPDGGLTKFTYDPAGNLTEKLTGNLLEWWPDGNGPIKYTYEYERPIRIDYPRNYQNQVSYAYGDSTAGFNRIGRVVLQQDATGGQEFYYGPLGEVEKTIRTIVVSQGDIRTYVSEQKYDTWNRVRWMAYPDSEVVRYRYNKGGLLEAMDSEKHGFQYPIIDKITYDAFEQRTYLKQGNGVVTTYEYEPDRRRLDTLSVMTPDDGYIMYNAYTYDPVNNVLSLANIRDVPTGGLGGGMVSTYGYDSLYRLVSAQGVYAGDGREDDYQLEMAYDDLHNITSKSQQHHSTFPWQVESTYDNTYSYAGTKPHALSHVGDRDYAYDANGNLTGWENPIVPTPTHREIAWDEENRMQALNDDGYISQFTYDASGERVLKSHGGMQSAFVNGVPVGFVQHRENYSIYVSPYLVVNKQGFTKHYYSEGQRLASRMGTGTFHQGLWPTTLQAGGLDYAARVLLLQQAAQGQYLGQDLPPGPPTMPNYYGQPQQGGDPVYVGPIANTQIPAPSSGWPQPVLVTNPGGVPGPPTVPLQTTSRDSIHAGYGFQNESNQPEPNRYFYHPDHLGSSSYITDAFGHVRQHIEYMAFGETFLEEHTNNETQPYLYNGKELDRETGLYYFGARYYDAKMSTWVSVDPATQQALGMSPYAAMNCNPVVLIDPDGNSTIANHYTFTYNAAQSLGMSPGESDNLAHYSSTFADHPWPIVAALEGHPYRSGIDYSRTESSQALTSEMMNAGHAMKAWWEPILKPSFTNEQATARGFEQGWDRIVESSSAKGVGRSEALGMGIHDLQDAVAHKGKSIWSHDWGNDRNPSFSDVAQATGLARSAIVTSEVMSGNYEHFRNGMTIDLTGTTDSQFNMIRQAFEKAITASPSDGLNNVRFTRD